VGWMIPGVRKCVGFYRQRGYLYNSCIHLYWSGKIHCRGIPAENCAEEYQNIV